jgi:hypothetical protein
MRLAGVTILLGLLVMMLVATGSLRARQRATQTVGTEAEPLLVGAERIYSSLSDADATATNTFLDVLEPADQRRQYLDDLTTATDQLAKVAAQAGTSKDAARALGVINKGLPTYSGLIEAARVNNRLGFPVGAAYLREGSTLMQTSILPAVGQLYQVEATRLDHAYNSGRSLVDLIGVLLVALATLAILAVTQGFLTRRTNRIFNLPLVVASLLAVLLLVWTVVAFTVSARRLQDARHKGSDAVQLLSSARILVARTQVDENLALVARGSGSQYAADFVAVTKELGPAQGGSGLLDEAESSVVGQTTQLTGRGGAYAAYLDAHQRIVDAKTSTEAVTLATATGTTDELSAAKRLKSLLDDRIAQAQTIFDSKAAAATHDLSRLSLGMIGLIVLAAALALLGLQQRISEYR